ncbi:MAG TPA: hypothetical protein VH835_08205, partial [Dongiaceae bacterium]
MTDITDWLQAGSVVVASIAAIYGVHQWRREMVGRRKAELAEAALADAYEAREIIEIARIPGGWHSGEGKT